MLVMKSEGIGPGGKVLLDERGHLKEVVEGKAHPKGALICTNAFVLSSEIFEYEPVKLTDREGEWGLPQTVVAMSKDHAVAVVEATAWIKITTPEDLKLAEKLV